MIYLHWQYNVSLSRLEEKVMFILSYSRTQIMTFNWWNYFTEDVCKNSFVYSFMRKICFMNNQSEEFDHLQSNGITNVREIKRRLALNPLVCNKFHYWIDYWYGLRIHSVLMGFKTQLYSHHFQLPQQYRRSGVLSWWCEDHRPYVELFYHLN